MPAVGKMLCSRGIYNLTLSPWLRSRPVFCYVYRGEDVESERYQFPLQVLS